MTFVDTEHLSKQRFVISRTYIIKSIFNFFFFSWTFVDNYY